MESNEFLKNLGIENQKIINTGSGSDWDLVSILDRYLSIHTKNYCIPDEINSKEEHKQYLKDIRFNLLHQFFNHKSDSNKYLSASQQEELENDFNEWFFLNAI